VALGDAETDRTGHAPFEDGKSAANSSTRNVLELGTSQVRRNKGTSIPVRAHRLLLEVRADHVARLPEPGVLG